MQFFFAIPLLLTVGSAHAAGGLSAILGDTHTMVFVVANLLLTIYFAVLRFDRFAVAHGPEILTTVGIFGCFFGIAMALLDFDAANVSKSVPQLLEGVKTAFWASVSGVFGALVIRFRHKFQKSPIPMSAGAPKAAGMDDVVGALQRLQEGLSGREDGSLLTQLKLLRQEQADQLGALRKSFESFAEKMAEDGSKALIAALKEVIADFNAKINEQFGENFKQLNAAVEKLVLWQQQYKEELDKLQAVQQTSAADLRQATTSLSAVIERAGAFADTADKLRTLLDVMDKQYVQIVESQRTLSTVLAEMRSVTPEFSKKLDELANSLKTGAAQVQAEVTQLTRQLGEQISGAQSEMKTLLTDTLKKSQDQSYRSLDEQLKVIQAGVKTLDTALQEELTKSLQTLGRQLSSLSEKFVADYAPLTERLRELVRHTNVIQTRG